MDRPIHVVGGGLAGLVAAISAAEGGAPVVVHDAAEQVGGRAMGGATRRGVNLGPHVIYTDGALCRWLRARGLRVDLRMPPLRGIRVLDDSGSHFPLGESLRLAPTAVPRQAPVDESLREWADRILGGPRSDVLCRLAGLFTFHHDPGALSARFVWDRYRRTFLHPYRVRSVAGGWSTLVDALAERAVAVGVRIEVGDRVAAGTHLGGPTIVATNLAAASRVLGRELSWPGARTALVDVAALRRSRWPSIVADLRPDLATCCMIERTTATEPELLDRDGAELFQAQLGIDHHLDLDWGVARIEDTFDRAVDGWRERVVWRRGLVVVDSTGAVDPPGATWRDRPALDQDDDRFLAGDAVAAPGMLSEVAVNSGVQAARMALEARRRQAFAVGWPSAELTPERRFAVLAAVLPAASLATVEVPAAADVPWSVEPALETGLGYKLTTRAGVLRGTAATSGPTSVRVTSLVSSRLPEPIARRVNRGLMKWRLARRRTSSAWCGRLRGRHPR